MKPQLALALALSLSSFAFAENQPTQSNPPAIKADKQNKNRVYEIAELDQKPSPKIRVASNYPYNKRQSNESGHATCVLTLSAKGEVTDVKIIESSDSDFGKAARIAFKKWAFRPGKKEGQNVACRIQLTMNFDGQNVILPP